MFLKKYLKCSKRTIIKINSKLILYQINFQKNPTEFIKSKNQNWLKSLSQKGLTMLTQHISDSIKLNNQVGFIN